jgi:molybdopterin converting factor small subunit
MPRVRVEFFGMPRQRAGIAAVDIDVDVATPTLGEVLLAARKQLPEFGCHCLNGDRLQRGLIANINGRTFTSEPKTALTDGDSVLILSADVGG